MLSSPYKKEAAPQESSSFILFVSRSPPDHRAIITSFPAIYAPGYSLEMLVVMR
jgi:hypothetical protein